MESGAAGQVETRPCQATHGSREGKASDRNIFNETFRTPPYTSTCHPSKLIPPALHRSPRPQSIHADRMSRNLCAKRSTGIEFANSAPPQRRMPLLHPFRIPHLRRIKPTRAIRQHLASASIQHGGRLCLLHAVRPEIKHVPRLRELGRRLIRAGGALVEEQLVNGEIHRHGRVGSVEQRDGAVTVGQGAGPEGDLALAGAICGGGIAPDAVGGAGGAVLVEG